MEALNRRKKFYPIESIRKELESAYKQIDNYKRELKGKQIRQEESELIERYLWKYIGEWGWILKGIFYKKDNKFGEPVKVQGSRDWKVK